MNRNTEGGRNKIFNRIAEEETMEISKIEEKKKKMLISKIEQSLKPYSNMDWKGHLVRQFSTVRYSFYLEVLLS